MSAAVKEDAERLELRARPRAVTRLNRKTIVLLVGGLGLLVMLAMSWGLRTPKHSKAEDAAQKAPPSSERAPRPEGLATLPKDYASMARGSSASASAAGSTSGSAASGGGSSVPALGPPVGEFGQPLPDASSRTRAQMHRGSGSHASRGVRDREGDDESAKGPVFFRLETRQRSASGEMALRSDAADAGLASAGAPRVGAVGVGASEGSSRGSAAGGSDRKTAFVERSGRSGHSYIYGAGRVEAPVSPSQLMAGTIIRAALITGINSDLPGQIVASVVENVFDTLTGSRLLVPQGSRLIGEYDSETTFGQRRVLLVWTRLIRPDGTSITLDRLPGTDAAGYAGVEDRVDWHSKRLAVGAAVSSLIGVGAELASPQRAGANGAVIVAGRDSIHESINDVGQEITKRNLDVQPTLIVRPGFAVAVVLNRDLVL